MWSSDITQITKFLLYCVPLSLLLRRGCQYSLCVSIMFLFLLMFCFQCVGANISKPKVIHIICFLSLLLFLLSLCFQCVGPDISNPKSSGLFISSCCSCSCHCSASNVWGLMSPNPKLSGSFVSCCCSCSCCFSASNVLGLMSPNPKLNRNMSKSKGWTLQSSLLMLWMEKTLVNNQTTIDDNWKTY